MKHVFIISSATSLLQLPSIVADGGHTTKGVRLTGRIARRKPPIPLEAPVIKTILFDKSLATEKIYHFYYRAEIKMANPSRLNPSVA
ncbi:hypothetical protein [Coxiella-like endosymbiont]|uniref:hypothetical protein n=1 Tax=Coxiella-like endosymbiont TaxID=1592897 RepID=UPI00272AC9CB|nr:hypothetical protein [Coxiella-like endosymbiont]